MIWTHADIDELIASIAKLRKAANSGILSVSYDGPPKRTVTYQSRTDMRNALADMVRALNDLNGTGSKIKLASWRKGFRK